MGKIGTIRQFVCAFLLAFGGHCLQMLCLTGFGTHVNTQNFPHFRALPGSAQGHSPPKCLFFMANAKLPSRPGFALLQPLPVYAWNGCHLSNWRSHLETVHILGPKRVHFRPFRTTFSMIVAQIVVFIVISPLPPFWHGALISEPRFSTPARCDFSNARRGNGLCQGFFFEKAVFPLSRGKNRISQGVENRGSLISAPLALRARKFRPFRTQKKPAKTAENIQNAKLKLGGRTKLLLLDGVSKYTCHFSGNGRKACLQTLWLRHK